MVVTGNDAGLGRTRPSAVSIEKLGASHEGAFRNFLNRLRDAGDDALFHPHAYDPETVMRLCTQPSKDLYVVAVCDGQILGYGMLRGWDEGFQVPSLGLAVDAGSRSSFVGRRIWHFLRQEAVNRGCPAIRVTIDPQNRRLVHTTGRLGFELRLEGPRWVGWLDLSTAQPAAD